jgi:hypothetical protein
MQVYPSNYYMTQVGHFGDRLPEKWYTPSNYYITEVG